VIGADTLVVMAMAASCAADGPAFVEDAPPGGPIAQGRNHPPRVTIERPRDGDVFEWDTLIRYAITVSDEEDGESEYEEIPDREVFLEALYVPDPSRLNGEVAARERDSPGLLLMKGNNCFNCHAVNTPVLGPPFSEVARRYEPDAAAVDLLSRRVVEGSSGAWGEVAMAPHPELTTRQARQMVRWVLEEAADPNRTYYAGTEGAFRTMPRPDSDAAGVYVLTATYTDQGLKGESTPRQRGQHTIVLHGPSSTQRSEKGPSP